MYLKDNFMPKRQYNLAKHEWELDDLQFNEKCSEFENQAISRIKAKINFNMIEEDSDLLTSLISSYVVYKLFKGTQYQEDYAEGQIEDFYATLADIKEEQDSADISPIENEDGSIPQRSKFW